MYSNSIHININYSPSLKRENPQDFKFIVLSFPSWVLVDKFLVFFLYAV